ncbi:MAG: class I SAM-dependent methyltransferase [Zetaproteobacteria bacterium]|nr:class I SAM-dependent methyltransferase [Zetaproteobacteria bacterium]
MVDVQMMAYANEVLRFRRALNLTSVDNLDDFLLRFIHPSVALNQWIPSGGVLLDVGSGMGVPGIPLLISRPQVRGILVERRKKRAEFLKHVVRTLNLNAKVYGDDINALPSLGASICVARAVTNVPSLLAMFSPHVVDGAIAVLPVPRSSSFVCDEGEIHGWKIVENGSVDAVENQRVECYKFCSDHFVGVKGDVSRET